MTISELKLALIKKIIEINDVAYLTMLDDALIHELTKVKEPETVYNKNEKLHEFSEWQQKKIQKAVEQYEKGECISDEEADKEILKWIEE